MKKRIEQSSEDVFDAIDRLSAEADWTEREIDAALREDGIEPEQLLKQVFTEVRAVFPDFPDLSAGLDHGAAQPARRVARRTDSKEALRAIPRPVSAPAISSLFDAGDKRGMNKFTLAAKLRLSIGIITKLNQRLIECSTIPMELVSEVASTVGHTVDDVLDYLRCKPKLAPGLSFKADEAPELAGPQDFVEAVEKDRSLGPERKKELMEMARKK
jgi:hypothetical protein